MMCYRYKRLLVPYSEGGLDERTRQGVERHLAGCAACARELEVLRSVSGALRAVDSPVAEPAPDLWAKVSARISADAAVPARRSLRVPQVVSAAAAVVLVAAFGFNMIRSDVDRSRRDEIQIPAPVTRSAPSADSSASEDRTLELRGSAGQPSDSEVKPVPRSEPPAAGTASPSVEKVTAVAGTGSRAPRRWPRATPAPREAVPGDAAVSKYSAGDRPDGGAVLYSATGVAHHPEPAPAEPEEPSVTRSTGPAASSGEMTAAAVVERHDYGAYAGRPTVADAVDAGDECLVAVPAHAAEAERPAVDVLNETEGFRTAALFSYP